MRVIKHKLFVYFFILFFQSVCFLQANSPDANAHELSSATDTLTKEERKKQEISSHIEHHLKDDHHFTLFSSNHKPYGFSLPVILWDHGFVVFPSSKLHEDKPVEMCGTYYTLYHGKIYETDASGKINYKKKEDGKEVVANKKPLDFSITKGVVSILLTMLLMLWLFTSLAKSYKKNNGVPTGIGRFFEPVIVYIRDDIAIPNIGKKHYKKYMPFLLTVFFFIWFSNMLGLTPLGINITGNIAITFGLSLFAFLITNLTAKKDYWKHIFWMPGVPILMRPFLALIELLGVIIKPFSLMIRLYANISAGHIVLMSILGMIFLFKTWIGSGLSFTLAFALSILELLVALLQAYIFTMLSALYFGQAVEEHEHHDHHKQVEVH